MPTASSSHLRILLAYVYPSTHRARPKKLTRTAAMVPKLLLLLLSYLTTASSRANTAYEPERYDFIVVGAGTAGSYLAYRLATSPGAPSVLLLEAGPNTLSNTTADPLDNPNLNSLIPGNFVNNVAQERINYMYTTTPQEELDGRILTYHRGKGLGGTSNLNYMAWVKGYRGDFDDWAEIAGDNAYSGEEGWDRIKNLESFDPSGLPETYSEYAAPDMRLHGTSGPIHNSLPKNLIPGIQTFINACEEAGIPRNLDFGSGEPLGASITHMAIYKGARTSSATQLLNDDGEIGAGLRRPANLVIKVDAKVNRIILSSLTKAAKGVLLENGKSYFIKKELIISAGFIDTPKLLLLSGIGPKDELEKLKIPVVADVPGVGKNMLDHTTVLLDPIVKQDLQISTGNSLFADSQRVLLEKRKWLNSYRGGKGEGAGELTRFGGSTAVSFLKFNETERDAWPEWKALTDEERSRFLDPKRPDTEIFYFTGYLPAGKTIPAGAAPNSYFRLFLLNQNHLSRGSITLASSNPKDQALINPRYLTHPYDLRVAVETVKTALKIYRTKTYSGIVEGMEFVGCAEDPPYLRNSLQKDQENSRKAEENDGFYVNGIEETDDGIAEWLKVKGIDQGYHGMGTCRMGKASDSMAVVDSDGRVFGVKNLRIADTSVVPIAINNHPQVSAYLIADVIADRLIETWSKPRSG